MGEEFWSLIYDSIRALVSKFEETPYFFYKEYDAQRFLYHLLISNEQFRKIYSTRDGKNTCLVHGEYPSSGNLPLDLVVLDPRGIESRFFRKQKIACAFELKLWNSAGYKPKAERKIRDTLVGENATAFVIYLARGGDWEYFRSKFAEFKAPIEEIFLESPKAMALVTKITCEK